jgi:alpha-mannosidase
VTRGSRVVEIEIDLQPDRMPEPDPWNSYYAARFAWADAAADVHRSVGLRACVTDVVQVEAPHLIDVGGEKSRVTLLSGGLPYHRRLGLRKLDTLLVVAGETQRRFALGIGINLERPVAAALERMAPQTLVVGAARPPAPSGWLFHVDARGVIATHWEPVVENGRMDGFRVRLMETDRRAVRAGLRSFRTLRSAQKVVDGDTAPEALAVEGDRAAVPLRAGQWVEVEARFAG